MQEAIAKAAALIKNARTLTAFTGAGISVESGIAPFRGTDGIWNTFDPKYLELTYFLNHPQESWQIIRQLFFENFERAGPNTAHKVLARLEAAGLLKAVITQNIDNLHTRAGSENVIEFHGNSRNLVCTRCSFTTPVHAGLWENLPPACPDCRAILKPDFVFFGETIPEDAFTRSFVWANRSDVMLVIGSTGEVYPAASVPEHAKQAGAQIIEINPHPSGFTKRITDVFLQGKATEMMAALETHVLNKGA